MCVFGGDVWGVVVFGFLGALMFSTCGDVADAFQANSLRALAVLDQGTSIWAKKIFRHFRHVFDMWRRRSDRVVRSWRQYYAGAMSGHPRNAQVLNLRSIDLMDRPAQP